MSLVHVIIQKHTLVKLCTAHSMGNFLSIFLQNSGFMIEVELQRTSINTITFQNGYELVRY